ncbi:hypothetical protein FHW37_108148 [Neorhizobium alkalisoli]|uniref:Uncharacterized protein n=2 Tax=Neorhizobium alkalisoli TaxID=528178 RepID=A0A561QGI1_9HYPH|nr:hypothetical protein FHW37_108148 [Neorhizobium alkalisoli]
MYMAQRLAELEATMRPVLEELGFECRLLTRRQYECITFVRPGAEEWSSAVEIRFLCQEVSGADEASWGTDTQVTSWDVHVQEIGNDGWATWNCEGPNIWGVDVSMRDAMLIASEMLRTEPLIPTGRNVPRVPNSYPLVELWRAIRNRYEYDEEVSAIGLARDDDGNETLSFTDDGRVYDFVFSSDGKEVMFLIDGEENARCKTYVRDLMGQLSSAIARYPGDPYRMR